MVCQSNDVRFLAGFFKRSFLLTLTLFVTTPFGRYGTVVAQNGQFNSAANANQTVSSESGSRSTPAPWRPSFGPLISQESQAQVQTGEQVSAIPARQQSSSPQNGLPFPNSPTTGINLQNGTAVTLGAPGNQESPIAIVPPQIGSVLPQSPPVTSSNPSTTIPPIQPQAGQDFADPQGQIDQLTGRRSSTRVTRSMNQLPNDAGQVWREYDITPYTSQISGIPDPQQAILNWILKETGTEMWFNQPLGILSAERNQLRVYHTPEIQNIVHGIVDRFVNTKGQVQNVQVSLVTIGKPNWRSTAYPVLQPIEVQSPGVEAWMITKENAALLRASLARRSDFKDHGTGQIAHNDGQTVVLRNTKPVQFIRNFRWAQNQVPSWQPLVTTIDEGYTLEISSLSSLDGNTIEASIQCHVDQVEKLDTVKVDVPSSTGAASDRINLQIPQLVSWRLEERFRWPNDQVLLMSCGVVATPVPQTNLPGNFPNVLGLNRQRADALLFIDYRGPALPNNLPGSTVDSRTVPVNQRR